MAKVASDLDKPDGLTVIRPEDVPRFIANLPIQKVPGVGTSGFKSGRLPVQLDLFDKQIHRDGSWSKIDQTLETITRKFGKEAIKRATLRDD